MTPSAPNTAVGFTPSQFAQHQSAQQAQMNEMQSRLARLRSRKPTDRILPDGIEDTIVDPDCVSRYRELSDLERRLDATFIRKRLDITDPATRNAKVPTALACLCQGAY